MRLNEREIERAAKKFNPLHELNSCHAAGQRLRMEEAVPVLRGLLIAFRAAYGEPYEHPWDPRFDAARALLESWTKGE